MDANQSCCVCGAGQARHGLAGYEHAGRVCSEPCGDALWARVGMLKREREGGGGDADLVRLERLLRDARDAMRVVNADGIADSLARFGCALVDVPAAPNGAIRRNMGAHTAETFALLPDNVKADLRAGDFESFNRTVNTSSAASLQIWGKSLGMINRSPLLREDYERFRSNELGLVLSRNSVAALNNIDMWLLLPDAYHPRHWAPVAPRMLVPDDGFKVKQDSKYGATKLHYDGQEGDTGRVQVIFCDDAGPVRLCAVPGSGMPEVRELIERITGVALDGSGFKAEAFANHPRVLRLLLDYGVALPRSGLLVFTAGTWHYEAVVDERGAGGGPLRVIAGGPRPSDADTKRTSVFRIYCGVLGVFDTPQRVRELIEAAFWREHRWAFDPFVRGNQHYALFVNEKGQMGQKGRDADPQELAEFARLNAVSFEEKRRYVFERIPPARLALYGLRAEDARVQDEVVIYE